MKDIQADADKVRPYDHIWDMYYDEFDDEEPRTYDALGGAL